MNDTDRDNRPRCEHLVVYPMENCTVCMKAEIAELKAKLVESERHRDSIVVLATKLVGNACDRHTKVIQSMDFDEFRKTMVLGCGWCNKDQLADSEKRGMEKAISIAQSWRDDGSRPWIGEQIADAIRAEIEKVKP